MYEIKSEDGETREFIVVPPEGIEFDQPQKLQEIESALSRAFPACKFQVTTSAPMHCQDFFFMPLMGVAGDLGNSQPMLKPPSLVLVEEITSFLAKYQHSESRAILH